MPAPRFGFVAVALVVTLSIAASDAARAEAPAAVALSGQVSSAEEGAMEGVVVSARRAGSTVTVRRRQRCARPLRLPDREAGARRLHAAHPRRGL